MARLRCYYAHTMLSYGSTIEKQDIELLEYMGFEVINPNSAEIEEGMNSYISKHGKNNVMAYFQDIVINCNLVAFRGMPDGEILSGVSAELQTAIEWNIPIIELPCSLNKRMQEYPETKKYLTEVGFYKTSL